MSSNIEIARIYRIRDRPYILIITRKQASPGLSRRHVLRSCRHTSSLYHNCDSTTMRLRHDFDEKLTCSFLQARAIRRSRIVGVWQSNRNCNHGFTHAARSTRFNAGDNIMFVCFFETLCSTRFS